MEKKVIFMGYHNMGCIGIKVLMDKGISIQAVFTHEDNPKEVCWFDSVQKLAQNNGIPIFTPENLNQKVWIERIRQMEPDAIFSVYYRSMICQKILDIPKYGAVNLHGSLLPKYRGRCPVNWQILHGETETGVTLHYMVRQADAGDIIGQKKVAIGPDDTALDVFKKLEPAAKELLEENVEAIVNGTAPRHPQDHSQASYFGGRKPDDGKISWDFTARQVHNLVRAVTTPYPGAFGFLGTKKIMIWKTRWSTELTGWKEIKPGTVFDDKTDLWIKTNDGAISPLEVSFEGEQNHRSAKAILKPGDILS